MLKLLKKDVLRGIPAGVGMRDWCLTEVEEEEVVGKMRRVKLLEVNLLRASEKDDLRFPKVGRRTLLSVG